MLNLAREVNNPFSLVALFGLILLFFLYRSNWKHGKTVSGILALILLAAGLYLAIMQIKHQTTVSSGEKSSTTTSPELKGGTSPKTEPTGSVHQETHGPGSPAVQGVTGNVTIQQGSEKDKK